MTNNIVNNKEEKKSIKIAKIFNKLVDYVKENWQQIIYGLIILVAVVLLIYSLGYSTPWDRAHTNTALSNIIDQARIYNIKLVNATLFLIAIVLIGLAVGSHNRKKYYWSNYLVMAIIFTSFIYTAVVFTESINKMIPMFADSFEDPVMAGSAGWQRFFYYTQLIRPDAPTQQEGMLLALEIGKGNVMGYLSFSVYSLILSVLAAAGVFGITLSRVLVLKSQRERREYRREMIAIADAKILEHEDVAYNTKAPIASVKSNDLNLDLVNQIQADNLDLTKVDKLRYQNNKLSYGLLLLSIITFLIGLFKTINYTTGSGNTTDMMVRPDVYVALFIALGIIMLLITFLTAEKVKTYNLGWSYGSFGLAAVHLYSIFAAPLYLLNKGELPKSEFIYVVVFYAISIALTVIAGVVGVIKTRALRKHLRELGEL